MKLIRDLSEMISEEISDAKKYAMCGIEHKDDEPELAKLFTQLATEELGHAMRLHDHVVRIIRSYREEHGEPPAPMMAVYEYLHKKNIDAAAEVKVLLSN